jgi:hypothetical protein
VISVSESPPVTSRTFRDASFTPIRLALLRRVVNDGDVYVRLASSNLDRWNALYLRASLRPLPSAEARAALALFRSQLVQGVHKPHLFGFTCHLLVTPLGVTTLASWSQRLEKM